MNIYTQGTAWAVAFTRAFLAAVVAGATSFLTVWSQTSDEKTLIIAGLTPFLAVIATRFGLEGAVDSRREP